MDRYGLDAHEKPPDALSSLFKHFKSLSEKDIEKDPLLIDLSDKSVLENRHSFSHFRRISRDELHASFSALNQSPVDLSTLTAVDVLESHSLPGGPTKSKK